MKHLMIAVCFVGLSTGLGVCAEEQPAEAKSQAPQGPEMTTDEEKVNYSLGFELGKDLKRQDLKLVADALLKGAEDAMSGGKPLVKKSQRIAALKKIREGRAQENLEKSQAFLAANAEKEGVKVMPSGLQYKVIKPGEGKSPQATSSVTVHYRGTLIDGTEFDSSYERGRPATFQLKKVIKGWREGLQLMKEGAQWELYIPPDLAYGKRSPGNRIPANSALVFKVELLSVK